MIPLVHAPTLLKNQDQTQEFSPFNPAYFPYGRVFKDCIRQGLFKVKGKKGNWPDRWVVLYYHALIFFKPAKTSANRVPKLETIPSLLIPLGSILGVILDTFKEGKPNVIEVILIEEKYFFQANSSEEFDTWFFDINALKTEVQLLIEQDKQMFMQLVSNEDLNPGESTKSKRGDSDHWVDHFSDILLLKNHRTSMVNFRRKTSDFNISQKNTVEISAKLFASQNRLSEALKMISEVDEYHELLQQLKRVMITREIYGIGALLEMIKRPTELLIEKPGIEVWYSPYGKIEELISQITETAKRYTKEVDLYPILDRFKIFYLNWIKTAKKNFGSITNVRLIVSQDFGSRIMNASLVERILGKRENTFGYHEVTSYGGIHFKRNPGAPGFEFAVHCLNNLVSGQGTSPTQLLKIQNVPIQASVTIDGVNLNTLLERNEKILDHISSENFSYLFLLGILTDLQDGKPENFLAKLRENNSALEVVGVDNDVAFADPIVLSPSGYHFINIKNIIYLLKQGHHIVNPKVQKRFLSLSPEVILFEWLRLIFKQNQDYDKMRQENFFSSKEFMDMKIPIKFREGTVTKLYEKFHRIKEILEKDSVTHYEILRRIQPEVYYLYQRVLEREKNTMEAFKKIFLGPSIEQELSDMMDTVLGFPSGKITLAEHIKSCSNNLPLDFIKKRTQTCSEAFYELLSIVDFSKLSSPEIERDILTVTCNSNIVFKRFILRGSVYFSDRMLQLMLEQGELEEITLINCTSITDEGIKTVIHPSIRPKIFLIDCPQITQSCVRNLVQEYSVEINYRITGKKSPEKVKPLPKSPNIKLRYKSTSEENSSEDLHDSPKVITLTRSKDSRRTKEEKIQVIEKKTKDSQVGSTRLNKQLELGNKESENTNTVSQEFSENENRTLRRKKSKSLDHNVSKVSRSPKHQNPGIPRSISFPESRMIKLLLEDNHHLESSGKEKFSSDISSDFDSSDSTQHYKKSLSISDLSQNILNLKIHSKDDSEFSKNFMHRLKSDGELFEKKEVGKVKESTHTLAKRKLSTSTPSSSTITTTTTTTTATIHVRNSSRDSDKHSRTFTGNTSVPSSSSRRVSQSTSSSPNSSPTKIRASVPNFTTTTTLTSKPKHLFGSIFPSSNSLPSLPHIPSSSLKSNRASHGSASHTSTTTTTTTTTAVPTIAPTNSRSSVSSPRATPLVSPRAASNSVSTSRPSIQPRTIVSASITSSTPSFPSNLSSQSNSSSTSSSSLIPSTSSPAILPSSQSTSLLPHNSLKFSTISYSNCKSIGVILQCNVQCAACTAVYTVQARPCAPNNFVCGCCGESYGIYWTPELGSDIFSAKRDRWENPRRGGPPFIGTRVTTPTNTTTTTSPNLRTSRHSWSHNGNNSENHEQEEEPPQNFRPNIHDIPFDKTAEGNESDHVSRFRFHTTHRSTGEMSHSYDDIHHRNKSNDNNSNNNSNNSNNTHTFSNSENDINPQKRDRYGSTSGLTVSEKRKGKKASAKVSHGGKSKLFGQN